jgi:hypothetical protein
MNKELKLLRTQPANTNTSVPLENVTNLLGIVANVKIKKLVKNKRNQNNNLAKNFL